MTIAILLLGFFPYTNAYLNLFYSLNRDAFQKTIELVNNGEIRHLQTDTNEYAVPYRSTSYAGVMYTEGVSKIMFFAYYGFEKAVVIVYSSVDSGIDKDDFNDGFPTGYNWGFSDIKKIDTNWYSATVPW